MAVFNERELHSRYEIFVEGYRKTINIESQLTLQMATRMILPAALRYQAEIAKSIAQPEGNRRHRSQGSNGSSEHGHRGDRAVAVDARTSLPRRSTSTPRATRSPTPSTRAT